MMLWEPIVDSSGYATYEYGRWYNAKYGNQDVRTFVKMHVMVAPRRDKRGYGDRWAQRRLARVCKAQRDAPARQGIVDDSAYSSEDNCQAATAAADKGRKPIMQPKANTTIHGFTEMASMLRFAMEHPGTIHDKMVVRLQNNVESVFSSMKQKFGAVVRAVRTYTCRRAALKGHYTQHDLLKIQWDGSVNRGGCARPSGD